MGIPQPLIGLGNGIDIFKLDGQSIETCFANSLICFQPVFRLPTRSLNAAGRLSLGSRTIKLSSVFAICCASSLASRPPLISLFLFLANDKRGMLLDSVIRPIFAYWFP